MSCQRVKKAKKASPSKNNLEATDPAQKNGKAKQLPGGKWREKVRLNKQGTHKERWVASKRGGSAICGVGGKLEGWGAIGAEDSR